MHDLNTHSNYAFFGEKRKERSQYFFLNFKIHALKMSLINHDNIFLNFTSSGIKMVSTFFLFVTIKVYHIESFSAYIFIHRSKSFLVFASS